MQFHLKIKEEKNLYGIQIDQKGAKLNITSYECPN